MWTLEQRAAIDIRNADLLVSAAAGSGKTAVLVERITQLVLIDQVPIDEMLIVTYTNAAAGEMRSRVEHALSMQMMQSGDQTFLQEQLKRLNRAHIKTFHAFCLDVVRQYFQELEIDPSFRMANESEMQVLIHQALEETLEMYYENADVDFMNLVEGYSGNRDDGKLRELILTLYRFIQSQSYPLEWLDLQAAQYETSGVHLCNHWLGAMEVTHKRLLQSGIELLKYAIEICEPVLELEGYKETLEVDLQGFERMLDLQGEAFAKYITQYQFAKLKPLRKEAREAIEPELIEEVKTEIRDKYIKDKIFKRILEFYDYKGLERYLDEIVNQGPLMRCLYEVIKDFTHKLDAAKRKRNVLDFNDLEHFAVSLLDRDEIAERYKSHFRYIFVDEYQDASGIQERILTRIKRINGLFMVGDIKQSIYKFRLADPQIFVQKYSNFTKLSAYEIESVEDLVKVNETLKAEDHANEIRVDLKKNFRTRPEILEAVNHIFERVMQPPLGEIEYNEDAKLYAGMAFEKANRSHIEVNLITKTQEDLGDDFFEDMKNDEIEARAAVLKIKSLLGTPVFHPKNSLWSPCQYKDIVILIRSVRSWTPVFESVFMEEGIPLYADNPSGYFDTLEIKFMLSLLKIIANPLDDIALLTVLRSPVVGLEISEIINLKAQVQKGEYLFEGIIQKQLQGQLEDRLAVFDRQLKRWRKASEYTLLDTFLWQVLKESGLYDSCIAMPGGASRAANLALLIERASELRQSQIVSLNQFIQFIEALQIASGDMGVANTIGENDDVVRLMSIHKSKGLEFPIVMMMGMGRKINLMDSYGDLLMHKDIGLALSYVDLDLRTRSKTLPQWVVKNQIQLETFAEELRVLYVGLTRPVDQLYIFGTFAKIERKIQEWQRNKNQYLWQNPQCYLDWMMPNWLNHPQVKVSTLSGDYFEKTSIAQNRTWLERVNLWKEDVEPEDDKTELKDVVWEILSAEYPVSEGYAPSKTSVTEMQRGFVPPQLTTTPSFLDIQKLTGAEKGTATHAFLERLDLKREYSGDKLKETLKELTNSGIFTDEESKAIDLKRIEAFLNSELGVYLKKFDLHYHETPFILKVEQQLIQGVIDLYLENDDGIVLIDFKTDYKVPSESDQVWQKYSRQIEMYRRALEKLTHKKVKESYLVFLMTGDVVSF